MVHDIARKHGLDSSEAEGRLTAGDWRNGGLCCIYDIP